MNVWDLLPTPGKVPGESIDPILQTWRIKRNFDDKWSQWVDFIEELWPRGRWHWQIIKNLSDTSYNHLQRLTTVLQTFTTVLQTLTTVLQTFATICGKINSQSVTTVLQTFATICGKINSQRISLRQEKLFPTIKTVCELVCNLLRTLTKSCQIQHSLLSQAFAAQCDTPLSENISTNSSGADFEDLT